VKVVVIGGTGTIGREVVKALSGRHEVVTAGRRSGDLRVDINSTDSIRALYRAVGRFDALVSTPGGGAWKPLARLTDADFQMSISNKLMGQVNLVRLGLEQVNDGGSFTLSSGVLAQEPTPGSVAVSLVNAGIEGFGRAAALELPRGVRLNVVSPPWVEETLQALGMQGVPGMPAERVAAAYVESVEGKRNGEVIDARAFA
jgi:NAD(P)-dependent dehydrogenase (short-subunit alcohol dehydrogenase family)